jgi:cytochrome c oxidase assembly protein subunit 15
MYNKLIIITLLLALAMTCLSAYIRLADSSLGCEPWPSCYGAGVYIDAAPGITIHKDDSNRGLRVLHRGMASLFGLLVLLLSTISLWFRKTLKVPIALPIVCVLLTLMLAIVGMNTPDILHPRVTLMNLVGGMALSGCMWFWMLLRHGERTSEPTSVATSEPLNTGTWILLVAITSTVVLICSGAWVSANYAATGCEQILRCATSSEAELGEAFWLNHVLELENGIIALGPVQSLIMYIHQVVTILVLLIVIVAGFFHYKVCGFRSLTLVPVLLMVLLGLMHLVSTANANAVLIATLHNIGSMLLLLVIVKQYFDVRTLGGR